MTEYLEVIGQVDDLFYLARKQQRCQAKKGYGTGLLALNAGWLISFKQKTRLSVYQCPVCDDYHLSRQVDRPTSLACVWIPGI